LERLAKKKPEPTSHLTFILFQNRHFLVWTTPGTVGSSTREDEAVRVRAWLDSPTYAFFQRLHVNADVSVSPRFHVYSPPVAAGFVPLSMEVAPIDSVEIGRAEARPTPVRDEGAGRTLLGSRRDGARRPAVDVLRAARAPATT